MRVILPVVLRRKGGLPGLHEPWGQCKRGGICWDSGQSSAENAERSSIVPLTGTALENGFRDRKVSIEVSAYTGPDFRISGSRRPDAAAEIAVSGFHNLFSSDLPAAENPCWRADSFDPAGPFLGRGLEISSIVSPVF